MTSFSGFQPRPARDDFPYKVQAIDYYKPYLLVGDDQGQLYRYPVSPGQDDLDIIKKTEKDQGQRPIPSLKKPIQRLKYIQGSGVQMVLMLADGKLHLLSFDLELKHTISENVTLFALNEGEKANNELLVIHKKDMSKYYLEQGQYINVDKKQVTPAPPGEIIFAVFLDSVAYVACNKKDYYKIDLSQKENRQFIKMNPQMPVNPWLYITPAKNIAALVPPNAIFFMDKNGGPVEKNMFVLSETEGDPNILGSAYVKPHLILLLETCIYIFNMDEHKPLQPIRLPSKQKGKCLTNSGDKIFYATHDREIFMLYLTPFEQLITKYIMEGKIEEAQQIFDSNVPSTDPQYEAKRQQLDLQKSRALLRQMKFQEAQSFLQKIDYDPREFLLLYPDFSSIFDVILRGSNIKQPRDTILMLSEQHIQKQLASEKLNQTQYSQELSIRQERYKQESLKFLAELFQQKRVKLMRRENLKEPLTFVTNSFSVTTSDKKLEPIPADELLKAMDFVIISVYIKLSMVRELKAFLQAPEDGRQHLFCKDRDRELLMEMNKVPTFKQKDLNVLAIFYESFDKPKESLEIWKQIAEANSNQPNQQQREASERTIKILIKLCESGSSDDVIQIKKYLKWVLRLDEAAAVRFFEKLPESLIPPEYIENDVYALDPQNAANRQSQDPNAEKARKLWEKYLKTIVVDRKIEDQRYHTNLAECYIDQLFRKYPHGTSAQVVNQSDPEIKYYLEELTKFLKNENSKYNSTILLNKIKDSWLLKMEILLYQREKKHDEALKKLIQNDSLQWAEDYCRDVKDKLLTRLFKMIVNSYKQLDLDLKKNQNIDQEIQRRMIEQQTRYKETITSMLKKYATDPEFDPLIVIDSIPNDWMLSNSEGDGLYSFLSSIVSHTLHKKRSINSCVHLNKMDMVNAEYHLVEAKEAYKIITKETKCVLCKRPVGEGIAFVVYPNGVVAHHKCIPNNKKLNVCVQTHEDFEKTFKG